MDSSSSTSSTLVVLVHWHDQALVRHWIFGRRSGHGRDVAKWGTDATTQKNSFFPFDHHRQKLKTTQIVSLLEI
jgi:hypothetical protein